MDRHENMKDQYFIEKIWVLVCPLRDNVEKSASNFFQNHQESLRS